MTTTVRDLKGLWRGLWDSVCPYVPGAVVFLDNSTAEILHWTYGVKKLFEAGATNIKEFSSFEIGGVSDKKAVFIVNDLLTDTVEEIISDILCASHFDYCIVITTISHSLHKHLLTSGDNSQQHGPESDPSFYFKDFEEKMLVWMKRKPSTGIAEVYHIPLSVASIDSHLFYLPAFQNLFPLLKDDLKKIKKIDAQGQSAATSSQEVSLDHLPDDLQVIVKKLVSTLSSICEELQLNEDVYCAGSMSRIIATELAGLQSAKPRRKAAPNRASLILVDRTLDLVAPASHNQESFMDKVLSTLPPLPGHGTDVAVDMTEVYGLKSHPTQSILVPGCLSHPNSEDAEMLIAKMINEKKKPEILRAFNRQLVETISKAKISDPATLAKVSKISVESLRAHVETIRKNSSALIEHSDKVQLTTACIQTLKHSNLKRQERLADEEKLLLQRLGPDVDGGIWKHIHSFLSKVAGQDSPDYSLEEVLEHLIYLSSLAGSDLSWTSSDKDKLKENLVQIFLKNDGKSDFVRDFMNYNPTEDNIRKGVNSIVSKIESVGTIRENLQKMSSVLEISSSERPPTYTPLLQQLFTHIFDAAKPELIDIEYKSSGLRDILKSGFSYFMNVSKPRPNDHSLMIVFILGGVTCSEVKMLKDFVSSKSSSTQIVVGSTQILKHPSLLKTLFCIDHLRPS